MSMKTAVRGQLDMHKWKIVCVSLKGKNLAHNKSALDDSCTKYKLYIKIISLNIDKLNLDSLLLLSNG